MEEREKLLVNMLPSVTILRTWADFLSGSSAARPRTKPFLPGIATDHGPPVGTCLDFEHSFFPFISDSNKGR